jgi:hypothetical protein
VCIIKKLKVEKLKVENLYIEDLSEMLLNLVPDLVYETRQLSQDEFERVKKELYLALRDAMFELKSCDAESRLYLLNDMEENSIKLDEFAQKWLIDMANKLGEPVTPPDPAEQSVIRVDFKSKRRDES